MAKRTAKQTDEMVVITLPANALNTMAVSMPNNAQTMHDAPKGGVYMTAAPISRDEPFPCYKKSAWEDRGIVTVMQIEAPRA